MFGISAFPLFNISPLGFVVLRGDRAFAGRALVRARVSDSGAVLSSSFFRCWWSQNHVCGLVLENREGDCDVDAYTLSFSSQWRRPVHGKIDPAAAGRATLSLMAGGDDSVHRDRGLWKSSSMVSIAAHPSRRRVCGIGLRVC